MVFGRRECVEVRKCGQPPRRRILFLATLLTVAVLAAAVPIVTLLFRRVLDAPVPVARTPVFVDPTAGIRIHGAKMRRFRARDPSCIIVACHTGGAPGAERFWKYYVRSGVSVAMMQFDSVTRHGNAVAVVWCRIPAVVHELQRSQARVLYLDLDTKVDAREWCSLPHAPIVMNSYRRTREFRFPDYAISGTRVQANAFVVAAGVEGLRAMKRWALNYYDGQYQEQGAIHLQEHGLCGVPGWIACYSNPSQQYCHCAAIKTRAGKERCIQALFDGKKKGCPL